jgi:hypothetical protein
LNSLPAPSIAQIILWVRDKVILHDYEKNKPALTSFHFLINTFPCIILLAGFPRIIDSLANGTLQCGQLKSPLVKSFTMLSLKHLTKCPEPSF